MHKKISLIGTTALILSLAMAILSGCSTQSNTTQNGSRVPVNQPTTSQTTTGTGSTAGNGTTSTGSGSSTTSSQNQNLSQLDQTLGGSFNDLSTTQQNADNSATPQPTEAQP